VFKNHLIVAFRNILRHKGHSLINVLGLAVGTACCLLILVDIQYELSYDRFHADSPNIYRALAKFGNPSSTSQVIEFSPAPLATEMPRQFSEVLSATRIGDEQGLVQYGDKALDEKGILWAESTFVDVFSFPVVKGDLRSTLARPYSVGITESAAKRLFGAEDPIGKVIRFREAIDLQVNAILKDVPENSHLQFDYVVSLSTQRDLEKVGNGCGSRSVMVMPAGKGGSAVSPWNTYAGKAYFKLAPGVDPVEFEWRLNQWVAGFFPQGKPLQLAVQSLTDIHLKGQASGDQEPGSDIRYVYFISALALVILLIACFNYVNLATARVSTRSREVGLRVVLGGSRISLMTQFLVESVLVTVLAAILSLLLVELLFPVFKTLTNAPLSLNLIQNRFLQVGLIGIVFFIGIAAGVYPAFVLSSCKPQNTIRGLITANPKGSAMLRKALVVIQNVISVFLIFCTVVVFRQLSFVSHKDLGLDTKNVITIPVKDSRPIGSIDDLKKRVADHPGVVGVTSSEVSPFAPCPGGNVGWWEGMTQDQASPNMNFISVDDNFLTFYGIRLIEGRSFSRDLLDDQTNAYVLNKSLVKALGWETAVGKKFGATPDRKGVVVGVADDFHNGSLHQAIDPLALQLLPSGQQGSLSIRLKDKDDEEVVSFIRSIWGNYSSYPFEFQFLDDRIASAYAVEQRLSRLFAYSAVLAIGVACLGLLGLTSFGIERKSKETAIRKVLGASTFRVAASLSAEFLVWVALAGAIAWPMAYYAMSKWLEGFAYRIGIGMGTFMLSGLLALLISILAVGYQTVKAARANPVDSLKYE
jgi:putative ABC transport system permease protein